MGLAAPRHVESSLTRDQTCSSALAGAFLTTGPPRKSRDSYFLYDSPQRPLMPDFWVLKYVCNSTFHKTELIYLPFPPPDLLCTFHALIRAP